MLMLWEDLIPGDKIKLTENAKLFWSSSGLQEIITVDNIIVIDNIIYIYIKGYKYEYMWIYKDGTYNNITIFEIVSLKDDE